MKYKFNLKKTSVTLIAVFTLFFAVQYIFSRDYTVLFFALCCFSATALISLFIYLLFLLDNRYRFNYVNADELSEETKEKIIEEDIKENQKTQKNSQFKETLYSIIFTQIYIIAFFELLLIIHFMITDIQNINKLFINTFPALLALIIAVSDIFKKIKK